MSDLLTRVRETLADRYDVEGEIGAGGMAVVFSARDRKHGRRVAIKVLRPELSAAVGGERFLREIGTAARLSHPNIVALHDSGDAGGLRYYVMPFVEGRSLRDVLAAEGPLAPEEAVRIATEVGEALAYAHEHGLVHRDVKPANVLLQAGHALVADFGIAAAAGEAGASGLTETGSVVGTLAYMSPEQALGEGTVDGRSDVYALGCVLYEMLTGSKAFEARSAQRLIARKVMGAEPSLAEARPDLPATLGDVVARALARDPAERFGSAGAFTAALQEALSGEAIAARARTERRRTVLRTAVATAALATVGWAGWALASSAGEPRMRRLAVLPIEDYSQGGAGGHLLEGMHQALISELQQAGVTIIGRRGVLRYAGSAASAREIAEHLAVDAVVEAGLLSYGDSVAIEVGLVDGRTEARVWSGRFSEPATDVLGLYRDVTRSISDEIRHALAPGARERLAATVPSVDPEVYDLVLLGDFNRAKLTPEGVDAAERYYEQALALDDRSASAWAGIAHVGVVRMTMGFASYADVAERIDSASARALALDPEVRLAEVGFVRVFDAFLDWRFDDVTRAFEAALRADPEHPQITAYYALHLHLVGRSEEGARVFRRALDLDPDDVLVRTLYGMELVYERRYEEAIAHLEALLRVTPNDPLALSTLRTAYHLAGRYEEAVDAWRRSYGAQGRAERVMALERGWEEGGYAGALTAVAELMERQSAEGTYVTPWQIGTLYTRAGDVGRALDFLEAAVEARDGNVPYLAVDPIFDFMRDEPRFRSMISLLGLDR